MSRRKTIMAIKRGLQAFSVGSYIHQSMVASRFDLHPTDMLAIHYLDQNDELTAGQLGKALGLTSGATTAAIERLVKMGFATREHSTQDRRRVTIRLNRVNIKKLRAAYRVIDQKLDRTLREYTEEELLVLSKFLMAL